MKLSCFADLAGCTMAISIKVYCSVFMYIYICGLNSVQHVLLYAVYNKGYCDIVSQLAEKSMVAAVEEV